MTPPLAYHLIWTTYGTWLPGDARGWIKSGVLGIQAPDPALEQRAREMMVESEVHLTPEQRAAVEATIRKHCPIRNWILHAGWVDHAGRAQSRPPPLVDGEGRYQRD